MANNKTFKGRIQLKHDTSANWLTASNNGFTPLDGEIIIYDDLNRIKIGDGSTKVNDLPFLNYSEEEIQNLIQTEFNNIDYSDTAITRQFVTKIDQSNGLINVERAYAVGENLEGTTQSVQVVDEDGYLGDYAEVTAGINAEIFNSYENDDVIYKNIATGDYSHAEGANTIASEAFSHAEGYGPVAAGLASHAEGLSTAATGFISHAEGERTSARGYASHAEGKQTVAEGAESHVEGWGSQTTPEAKYSHAEGYNTYTEGEASHVEGNNTTASGASSHAEGYWTTAYGEASHVEGYQTTTSGNNSHAEGYSENKAFNRITKESSIEEITEAHMNNPFTLAYGNYSHVEGHNTLAIGEASHAEGKKTIASGENSHAENGFTTASGDYSHAEGNGTRASGNDSHAEGGATTASGYASHAEGIVTDASGNYSHAEGDRATAAGEGSHAEGYFTAAEGDYSHAEGEETLAQGKACHAEGYHTTVTGDYSHVQGIYNIDGSNLAHIVGNGTFSKNSNAHTLDWNGNAWFAGNVYIGSTSGTNKDEGSIKLAKDIAMSGATSSVTGTSGLVPAPAAGDQNKFLKGDGTWGTLTPNKITLVATAGQTSFSIPFEYDSLSSNLTVYFNGILMKETDNYTVNTTNNTVNLVDFSAEAGDIVTIMGILGAQSIDFGQEAIDAINDINAAVIAAKLEINTAVSTGKSEINNTVSTGKSEINTAVSTAKSDIDDKVEEASAIIEELLVDLPSSWDNYLTKNAANTMEANGKITMASSYTPSNNYDVTTKTYVDNAISTATSAIVTDIYKADSTAPTNTKLLWIDTGNSNILKYHNGSAWTPVVVAWA